MIETNALYRYTKLSTNRRVTSAVCMLLQDAHEVENGRVLMSDEIRQTVTPFLAGIVRPLRFSDSEVRQLGAVT